jgi:HSP20 family protein
MKLVRYSYPSFPSASRGFARFHRSPWSGFENEIDRLFESVLGDANGATTGSRFPVDLYEDENNTYVRAELPGVNREDINVEIANGYLTINAVRKNGTDKGNAEPSVSVSFSRTINVEDDVAADKVAANLENGVLTVTLPKREETKPKKVSITVN